jgi:DNA-binding ferritin-like protein
LQEERVQKLRRLEEQKAQVQALRTKVQHLAENDPAILEELERKVRTAKEGSDRWTGTGLELYTWVA